MLTFDKTKYDSLENDQVKFLQGTQDQLNLYLATAPDTINGVANDKKGAAIEGAFYLTTDTHRLYVGRKITSVPADNAYYNVVANKVYPEEVSTGISVIESTGDLPNPAGLEAHDGDFYYIKQNNILAVYEYDPDTHTGSWQQINSPTGLTGYTAVFASSGSFSTTFPSTVDQVKLHTEISAADQTNPLTTDLYIKAGDNITIKKSSAANAIEISSANSQSELSVTEATYATNKAPVVLSDNVNLDTKVYFKGENYTAVKATYNYVASSDTTVNTKKTYYTSAGNVISSPTGNPSTSSYYERENVVTVAGPNLQGNSVIARGTAGNNTTSPGFAINTVLVDPQTGGTETISNVSNAHILDPTITVGKNTQDTVHFYGGNAILDVYTSSEVDNKIDNKITDSLKAVDALHYKGTVGSPTDVDALGDSTIANYTPVSAGDVYKATSDFTYDQQIIKTGDLLIAKGDEYQLTSDQTADTSKTYYTKTNGVYTPFNGTPTSTQLQSLYEFTGEIAAADITWEIVPSGDEPWLTGTVTATTTLNPAFGLLDRNISGDYATLDNATKPLKRPLYVAFDNANSTLIKAQSSGTADNFVITLHHKPVSSYDANNDVSTLSSETVVISNTSADYNTAVDSIQDGKISFTAIKGIYRDAYGHVTRVAGEDIVLQHNYISSLTSVSSIISPNNASDYGRIRITAGDSVGHSIYTDVKIGSDTLALTCTNNNDQLNINLTWGSF